MVEAGYVLLGIANEGSVGVDGVAGRLAGIEHKAGGLRTGGEGELADAIGTGIVEPAYLIVLQLLGVGAYLHGALQHIHKAIVMSRQLQCGSGMGINRNIGQDKRHMIEHRGCEAGQRTTVEAYASAISFALRHIGQGYVLNARGGPAVGIREGKL